MSVTEPQMLEACKSLGLVGIGVFAPTLLTADWQELLQACRRWGAFIGSVRARKIELPKGAALPLGIHLEGPFLNPDFAGAHDRHFLIEPTPTRVQELLNACQGELAIVTLAPELPGALEAIKILAKKNVRVQLGHSRADAATVRAAVKAGAAGLTHLFNAMKFHHRETGLFSALFEGAVTSEIITDGEHVSPQAVLWAKRGASGRVYAVSDACSALLSKPGVRLRLGPLILDKRGPVAFVSGTETLAGGATPLTQHPAALWRKLKGVSTPGEILELFQPPACRHLEKRFKRFSLIPAAQAALRRRLEFAGSNLQNVRIL